METIFVKQKDKQKWYIIEGIEKPGQVLSVKRFICEITPQETEKETEQLADFVLKAVKAYGALTDYNLDNDE